jgi:hypothetical protein
LSSSALMSSAISGLYCLIAICTQSIKMFIDLANGSRTFLDILI